MTLDIATLFPAPVYRRYFLWATGWEEMEYGLPLSEQAWTHPGHDVPDDDQMGPGDLADGSFSTEGAVALSWEYVNQLLTSRTAAGLLTWLSEQYTRCMTANDPAFAQERQHSARVEAALNDGTLPAMLTTAPPRQDVREAVQLSLTIPEAA